MDEEVVEVMGSDRCGGVVLGRWWCFVGDPTILIVCFIFSARSSIPSKSKV